MTGHTLRASIFGVCQEGFAWRCRVDFDGSSCVARADSGCILATIERDRMREIVKSSKEPETITAMISSEWRLKYRGPPLPEDFELLIHPFLRDSVTAILGEPENTIQRNTR